MKKKKGVRPFKRRKKDTADFSMHTRVIPNKKKVNPPKKVFPEEMD